MLIPDCEITTKCITLTKWRKWKMH